jgi:hypothetical protein
VLLVTWDTILKRNSAVNLKEYHLEKGIVLPILTDTILKKENSAANLKRHHLEKGTVLPILRDTILKKE